MRDGLGMPGHGVQRAAEVAVRLRVLRIERERLAVVLDRLLVAGQRVQHGAEVVVRARQTGLERQRLADRRHRLLGVALLVIGDAQEVVRAGVAGRPAHDLAVEPDGFVQPSCLVLRHRLRERRVLSVGLSHAGRRCSLRPRYRPARHYRPIPAATKAPSGSTACRAPDCASGRNGGEHGRHPAFSSGTFSSSASDGAMVLDFDDIALRLGAAALAGVALGINRDLQNKPIGARTLGLVALGAATVAVAGIQFPGMAENPDAASRVVQGIIQGVMAASASSARA